MALSGAPERTTFVTSDPSLSPRIAPCRLLRGVVPWIPVILVELVPYEPGGDTLEQQSRIMAMSRRVLYQQQLVAAQVFAPAPSRRGRCHRRNRK